MAVGVARDGCPGLADLLARYSQVLRWCSSRFSSRRLIKSSTLHSPARRKGGTCGGDRRNGFS